MDIITSDNIYPKIIAGKATLTDIAYTDTGNIVIEDIAEANTPFEVFFRVDSSDYLFKVPWFNNSHDITINPFIVNNCNFIVNGINPLTGLQVGTPGKYNLLISFFNEDSTGASHSVEVSYFIYQMRQAT